MTRSFDVSFDLILNKRLSKQWWGWWFVTPSHPLWSHCNDIRANMAMVSEPIGPQGMYSTVAVYQISHFQTVCSEWYLKQFLFRCQLFRGLLAYKKITVTYLIGFRINHIFLLLVDFVDNFAKYIAELFKCKRIEMATTLNSPPENCWGCMLIEMRLMNSLIHTGVLFVILSDVSTPCVWN